MQPTKLRMKLGVAFMSIQLWEFQFNRKQGAHSLDKKAMS